jgi:hypothetical protein
LKKQQVGGLVERFALLDESEELLRPIVGLHFNCLLACRGGAVGVVLLILSTLINCK